MFLCSFGFVIFLTTPILIKTRPKTFSVNKTQKLTSFSFLPRKFHQLPQQHTETYIRPCQRHQKSFSEKTMKLYTLNSHKSWGTFSNLEHFLQGNRNLLQVSQYFFLFLFSVSRKRINAWGKGLEHKRESDSLWRSLRRLETLLRM